jgi:hypothetical protein
MRATKAQKAFCSQADQYKASKEVADSELRKLKKPATSDAQAEMYSAMTGLKVEAVETGLSIVNTLVLELGANILLLFSDAVPWRQKVPVELERPPDADAAEIEARVRAQIEAEEAEKTKVTKRIRARVNRRARKVVKKEEEKKKKAPGRKAKTSTKRQTRKRQPAAPPTGDNVVTLKARYGR